MAQGQTDQSLLESGVEHAGGRWGSWLEGARQVAVS